MTARSTTPRMPATTGPRAADALEAGSPADAPSRRLRQVVDDGEGGADGHGEEHRHRQVEGDLRQNARQLDQRRRHELAEVVVVHVAAGEPGVVGRHRRAAGDGVEIGQVHRLLAAAGGMPEVRVERADPVEDEECPDEQRLAQQDAVASARARTPGGRGASSLATTVPTTTSNDEHRR